MKRFYLKLIIALLIQQSAIAQEEENSGMADAASNATNPLAFITKFQVQPNYTFKDNSATQFNLTTRIVQPTKSIGLPFIKSKNPSKIYTIYRLEAPIIGQTFPNTPSLNATGLSDIVLLDVIAFKQDWGLFGIGPGLIIPTAIEPAIGSGKWSAGLTAVYLNTKTKGIQFGALFQQFNSFAGQSDRPDKNFMLFQPIFNKILGKGLFLQFSPIMNFNWESNQYNIPLSLAIGKAFAKLNYEFWT